ncbi:MAG: Ig-like domain-containing protein [Bacteroidales bacterium]|jgi:hypothetical protein|nr:Ig-like domain-containing protein [Bacteroidales bacterium]
MKNIINLLLSTLILTAIFTSCVEDDKKRVTGVTIDKSTLVLAPDSTAQLTATVTPENAELKDVVWTSTSLTAATVSQTGLVTAVADGKTYIIVTTNDGGFTDSCAVTVSTEPVIVENDYKLIVDLNPSSDIQLLDPSPESGEYWKHRSFFKLWEHKEGYGHGVKIIIVGECFDKEDNKDNGAYETWCKKMTLRFLENPIIRNFRNYFDVYCAVAVSRVSGINAATAGNFGTTTTVGTDFGAANKFTAQAIPELSSILNRSFILLANGMMGGWANFGVPAGNCGSAWWSTAMNEEPEGVGTYWMMHEFIGHGFTSLADEYPDAGDTYTWGWQQQGMALNVSNTSDLKKVPWSRFIGLEGYEEVGAYKIRNENRWIPEEHSIMVDNSRGFYYNAQSRWLIYKHIYNCSKFFDNESGNNTSKPLIYQEGEEDALFNAFLEFDKIYNYR